MKREKSLAKIADKFHVNPVLAILGPRQCGKTTLSSMYAATLGKKSITVFDLEKPVDLAVLEENPYTVLSGYRGLIIIDEIQRRPELFPVLRVLVDEKKERKFLILGSASRDLIKQSSETLAGRISYLELTPFSIEEASDIEKTWIRGGFPRSYLSETNDSSFEWRSDFIRTFLERDIPNLGFSIPADSIRRTWSMLAHYHGKRINYSEIATSLSFGRNTVSDNTVRNYIDILCGTFMIRRLKPWFENMVKRQRKTPKLYFRDSGIFHSMLGIKSLDELYRHPFLGFSWEGFIIEEIIRYYEADNEDCYYWEKRQKGGAELDLIILKDGKMLGFEIKATDSPKITKSINIALEELGLNEISILYRGEKTFALGENVKAVGVNTVKFPQSLSL
ncbi:MAG: ATP-binding protein [Nitrospinae bacterium]|nr:ATP-binding protein [Nitrospinota bacterium]